MMPLHTSASAAPARRSSTPMTFSLTRPKSYLQRFEVCGDAGPHLGGRSSSASIPASSIGSLRLRQHLGDPAGEVKGLLRHGVVNAVEDLATAAEAVAHVYGDAGSARVRFGAEERLREEALEL